VLTIKNIDKIIDYPLDSKWLPKTKGWIVSEIEEVGDTYIFVLKDTNGMWGGAEVQLRREWNLVNGSFERQWELWAWDVKGKPIQRWCKWNELSTIKEIGLWISYVLDKILEAISETFFKIL
jgi:hypothetical protein